ncbi:hypothetical protein [Atlantibacter subterraneus]|uniref:hypothetical protein n=1 Tax=Atlantibacter subterraneus TaxID=255519 RepID=UPI00289B962D|nr:hypothetical protein [Atlantibacter subterranea]
MRLNISELIHAAYHAARYLPKASSQLIRDLAERLDTTQAALCESLKIRDALTAERDAVNADNVYLRDQVLCWARECDRITYTYTNKVTDAHQSEAEQELANTLPAADAWVNEQRAVGVEMFVSDFTEPAVMNDGKFYSEDLIKASREFAAQLRGSQV